MGVSILRANSLKTAIRRVDLRGQSRRRIIQKKFVLIILIEFKNKSFWSKQQCWLHLHTGLNISIYQSSRRGTLLTEIRYWLGLFPSWPSRPCRQLLFPIPKNLILLVLIHQSSSWMKSSRTLWAHRKPGVQSHWQIVLQSEGGSRYLLILLFHCQINSCVEGWIQEDEPRDTLGIDSSDGTVRNDPFPCELFIFILLKALFLRDLVKYVVFSIGQTTCWISPAKVWPMLH